MLSRQRALGCVLPRIEYTMCIRRVHVTVIALPVVLQVCLLAEAAIMGREAHASLLYDAR